MRILDIYLNIAFNCQHHQVDRRNKEKPPERKGWQPHHTEDPVPRALTAEWTYLDAKVKGQGQEDEHDSW